MGFFIIKFQLLIQTTFTFNLVKNFDAFVFWIPYDILYYKLSQVQIFFK